MKSHQNVSDMNQNDPLDVRLYSLFMNAPAFMAVLSGPEHVFEMANPLYHQIVGRNDLVGRSVREVFPEIEGQGYFELLDEVYTSGEPFIGSEMPVTLAPETGDQTREMFINFVYQPITDDDGTVTGIFVHGVDVTEQVRARQQVEEERARLEAILEQVPAGVIIAEVPTGRLVFANAFCERLFDGNIPWSTRIEEYDAWQPHRPDGQPYDPEEVPLARAIRNGETVVGEEMQFPRDEDTPLYLSVNAGPIYNSDGEMIAAVAAFQDITSRVEAEQALQTFTETLEQRVQARTQQVRDLASALTLAEQRERHRIAQILHDHVQQLIHGLRAQLVLVRQAERDEQSAILAHMDEIAKEALHATRNLVVGLSPPVLEDEDLADALHWLAEQMEELHELSVTVEVTDNPRAPSEEMRVLLFQAVRELLFNVVKHANVNEARVQVSRQAKQLVIVVEDQGRGFDVTTLPESDEPHTGFGLKRARERLELFDGSLKLTSTPGEGTRAVVTVPVPVDGHSETGQATDD